MIIHLQPQSPQRLDAVAGSEPLLLLRRRTDRCGASGQLERCVPMMSEDRWRKPPGAAAQRAPGTPPTAPPMAAGSVPSAGWLLQIGAARAAWSRLSDEDLLMTEGRLDKLILLIQQRYSLSLEDATKRVQHFLDKQQS